MNWTELVTAFAAGVGAVLGIMNTWQAIGSRRLKLKVRASHAILTPSGQDALSIEVINFSHFPVTVEEAGFALTGGQKMLDPGMRCIDGGEWPRRLQSRESLALLFDREGVLQMIEQIVCPYIRTSCGVTVRGDKRRFKRFSKRARQS